MDKIGTLLAIRSISIHPVELNNNSDGTRGLNLRSAVEVYNSVIGKVQEDLLDILGLKEVERRFSKIKL